ncbi:MAG: class I SAM-dependent methyltransferase [Putridiphycobacter sp.]|nr:class I SAM-dependent methyltransferase [Putridiphycobacter sp.]
MNTIKECPICHGTKFSPVLTAKDFTVSHEMFSIVSCSQCQFQFTNPIPSIDTIGEYYKSESYVSHTSSKKGLINRIYHIVRSYTLKRKVGLVRKMSVGNKILDIGAGTGHFVKALIDAGFEAEGLEPDIDARAIAKSSHNVSLSPIEELYQVEEKSCDVITMWHVLEHVYHLQKDVHQISKILKDDGTLIVAVPNRLSYDAQKYKAYWAAYDLPIHLYHFTPRDISTLFAKFNMEVSEVLPMKFDSFYVSMLSEQYKGGNMIRAFWTGLLSNLKARSGSYSSQIYVLRKK